MELLTKSENMLKGLDKLGIDSSEKLMNYLPFRYENNAYSDLTSLEDKMRLCVKGKLVSTPKHINTGKYDIINFSFISEDNHLFNVKVFNQPYLMKNLTFGETFSVIGTYSSSNKTINAQSVKKGEIDSDKTLRPVYHLVNELSLATFNNLMARTFKAYDYTIEDYIPSDIKAKYRLDNKKEALEKVHFPKSQDDIVKGLRTLKYEECLTYTLKNQLLRRASKRELTFKREIIDTNKINEFILNLPFKPTHSQIKAIREIILDMNSSSLMYRLLQGDVGMGKTLVAFISLYANALRHKVGAFMVPTDTLARQQYEDAKKYLEPYGIRIGLLIGGLSLKEKAQVKEDLINNKIDVLVGTHALFSEDVIYPSLGLAIIDEQHRFGVNQRNLLVSKDENCDLLLMSATPIPRTLALTIYGDLDVSTLDEYPFEKRKVETLVLNYQDPLVISSIREAIENKSNVFIVAPKIKDQDDSLTSAEKLHSIYHLLFKDNVQMLTGNMDSKTKDEILSDFIAKKFLVLVSTTVIELGINVKDSSLIIVYNASSFGLASLHQLRGRVGRNGQSALCILLDEDENNSRLQVLKQSNDGFYIAEQDLKMRGPGDTLGLAQSGFPTFASLNIVSDFKMFECALADSKMILENLNNGEYQRFIDYCTQENKDALFD